MSRLNKCIDETGKSLRECNEDIVKKLCDLIEQRDELVLLIEKQYEEKKKIETDLEKLTYKLCLINKSLYQRLKTKSQYDRTIEEIDKHYKQLIENSQTLRDMLQKHHSNLEGMMNKKTSTEPCDEGAVKVLYAKKWVENVESDKNQCACDNMPTKGVSESTTSQLPTSERPSKTLESPRTSPTPIKPSVEKPKTSDIRPSGTVTSSDLSPSDIEKIIHAASAADYHQLKTAIPPPPKIDSKVEKTEGADSVRPSSDAIGKQEDPKIVEKPIKLIKSPIEPEIDLSEGEDSSTLESATPDRRQSDRSATDSMRRKNRNRQTSFQVSSGEDEEEPIAVNYRASLKPLEPPPGATRRRASFPADVVSPPIGMSSQHVHDDLCRTNNSICGIVRALDRPYQPTPTTAPLPAVASPLDLDRKSVDIDSIFQETEIEQEAGKVQAPPPDIHLGFDDDVQALVNNQLSRSADSNRTSLVLKEMHRRYKDERPPTCCCKCRCKKG